MCKHKSAQFARTRGRLMQVGVHTGQVKGRLPAGGGGGRQAAWKI
jgi:hypothetical protein